MLTWKDNIISEQFVEQSKDHHHFVAKIPGIHTLHCTENTSYSISIRSMKSQYRLQLTDVTRCVPYPTEWWCLATSRGYYTYQLLSTQGLTLNILCVLGICSYSFSKQIHVVIWQKINSLKKGKKKKAVKYWDARQKEIANWKPAKRHKEHDIPPVLLKPTDGHRNNKMNPMGRGGEKNHTHRNIKQNSRGILFVYLENNKNRDSVLQHTFVLNILVA